MLKIIEISCYKNTCRKLKCLLLSEEAHLKTATYCMIPTLRHSGKDKIMETVKRPWLSRVRKKGGMNR